MKKIFLSGTKIELKKAVMKKDRRYKFGQSLAKGQTVYIKSEKTSGGVVYTAFKSPDEVMGLGVNKKDFAFTKTYEVLVSRISYASRNIEVEAADAKEAKRMALDKAGDFEFSEHDADYVSDGVIEKE